MKKIKKIRLNEALFALSSEEMRHIGGGMAAPKCVTGKCEGFVKFLGGKRIEFKGKCALYVGKCRCYYSYTGEYYGSDDVDTNACIASLPLPLS